MQGSVAGFIWAQNDGRYLGVEFGADPVLAQPLARDGVLIRLQRDVRDWALQRGVYRQSPIGLAPTGALWIMSSRRPLASVG